MPRVLGVRPSSTCRGFALGHTTPERTQVAAMTLEGTQLSYPVTPLWV